MSFFILFYLCPDHMELNSPRASCSPLKEGDGVDEVMMLWTVDSSWQRDSLLSRKGTFKRLAAYQLSWWTPAWFISGPADVGFHSLVHSSGIVFWPWSCSGGRSGFRDLIAFCLQGTLLKGRHASDRVHCPSLCPAAGYGKATSHYTIASSSMKHWSFHFGLWQGCFLEQNWYEVEGSFLVSIALVFSILYTCYMINTNLCLLNSLPQQRNGGRQHLFITSLRQTSMAIWCPWKNTGDAMTYSLL